MSVECNEGRGGNQVQTLFFARCLTACLRLYYSVFMKILKVSLLLSLFSLIAGCTGYQMGSNLPDSVQAVFVHVENKTDEPSIEVEAMKALREEIQRDGRLVLRSEREADAVLNVTLTHYHLTPLAYDNTHGTLAREYRVSLSATAVLTDLHGKVLREVPGAQGDAEFPYAADLTAGKRGALPGAADDLARKVVSMTIAAW
jgi:hypothetical protein